MERAPQDEQNGTTKNAESQIDAGLNVSTMGLNGIMIRVLLGIFLLIIVVLLIYFIKGT